MGLSDYVDAKWFFGALFVGIMIVYLMAPSHQIVYKFPTPYKPNMVFSGADGECFKFDAHRVNCDDFKGSVKDQPGIAEELLQSTPA